MRRYIVRSTYYSGEELVEEYPSLRDILVIDNGRAYLDAPDIDVAIEWLKERAAWTSPDYADAACIIVGAYSDEGSLIEIYDSYRE